MRISDWSSHVCSSDLQQRFSHRSLVHRGRQAGIDDRAHGEAVEADRRAAADAVGGYVLAGEAQVFRAIAKALRIGRAQHDVAGPGVEQEVDRHAGRSEEHTSELQSLMRLSYARLCLNKK